MEDLTRIANHVIDVCDSTNAVARLLAEKGYPHGTWVSSRVQTQGRGRLGRSWVSSEGNLFLSLISRNVNQSHMSWVPLCVAISVVNCLRDLYSELDIKIKWPNDIFIGNSKLGGILCEGSNAGGAFSKSVIIGVGINCMHCPEQMDQPTTHLSHATYQITADDIRNVVIEAILQGLNNLKRFGPEPLQSAYETISIIPYGTRISWSNSPRMSGTVIGLGAAGELIVETEPGVFVNIYADDVKILFG